MLDYRGKVRKDLRDKDRVPKLILMKLVQVPKKNSQLMKVLLQRMKKRTMFLILRQERKGRGTVLILLKFVKFYQKKKQSLHLVKHLPQRKQFTKLLLKKPETSWLPPDSDIWMSNSTLSQATLLSNFSTRIQLYFPHTIRL